MTSIETNEDIRKEISPNGIERLIFDPFNPLNKSIQEEDIYQILRKYGINDSIYNLKLYKRAFVHRSYTKQPDIENQLNNITIAEKPDDCIPLFTKSNERLEFVGDGVLELITKYYLYRRFPKENEGFMTEKKIALVKNEHIGKIAFEMGLHKWFVLSKHAEIKQTRSNLKKLGCLFEAFIGAMFLDFNKIQVKDEAGWFSNLFVTGPGFQMVQIFVENIFEQHVDWVQLIQNNTNYKNTLQIIIQKEFKVTPHYIEMHDSAPDSGYHMGVYLCLGQAIHETTLKNTIPSSNFTSFNEVHEYLSKRGGKIFMFMGEGKHAIKKKAEQIACERAIEILNKYEEMKQ
jgi:dsRNA-specific ribonuclease